MMKARKHIGRKSACVLITMVSLGLCWVAVAAQGDSNGAATQMPAYYDAELFTVNMKQMPNSDPLIEHNGSINQIYASNDLDEMQEFVPVLDAIQSDGFNPLWQQNLYVFNEGFTPHQFFSDDEVLGAAASGEITLTQTDEVYRCSVVGPGPKIPKK